MSDEITTSGEVAAAPRAVSWTFKPQDGGDFLVDLVDTATGSPLATDVTLDRDTLVRLLGGVPESTASVLRGLLGGPQSNALLATQLPGILAPERPRE